MRKRDLATRVLKYHIRQKGATLLLGAFATFYLFLTKSGVAYSRISMLLMVVVYVLLITIAFIYLYPVLYMFSRSLMTKNDLLRSLIHQLRHKIGTAVVGQMAVFGKDPAFEKNRIRTVSEHLLIII